MSVTAYVAVIAAVWLALGAIVGTVVGRAARNRDRQTPLGDDR